MAGTSAVDPPKAVSLNVLEQRREMVQIQHEKQLLGEMQPADPVSYEEKVEQERLIDELGYRRSENYTMFNYKSCGEYPKQLSRRSYPHGYYLLIRDYISLATGCFQLSSYQRVVLQGSAVESPVPDRSETSHHAL